jgi:hypothetical protein
MTVDDMVRFLTEKDVGRVGRQSGRMACLRNTDWVNQMLIKVNQMETDSPYLRGYKEALLDVLGGFMSELGDYEAAVQRVEDAELAVDESSKVIIRETARAEEGTVPDWGPLFEQHDRFIEERRRAHKHLEFMKFRHGVI